MNFFKDVYHVAWGDIRFMRHNFHNILISRISNVVYMLEVRTTEFMDLLHENA